MNEKSNLQDQSLMAFEEHEEKLHKIQQQETVSRFSKAPSTMDATREAKQTRTQKTH